MSKQKPTKQKRIKKPKPDPTILNPEEISEGNWVDKIFKELLNDTLPTFLTEILHFPASQYQTAYIELQHTIEKRTDFLGQIFANKNNKTIVHLEVQNQDKKSMVYSVNVYSALILERYEDWDLEQFVFFIGKDKPQMPTHLKRIGTDFSFKLIWIKDIHYTEFINTGKPELILLAALANYGDKNPTEVIEIVVNEVQKLSKTTEDFEKRIEQLHILTNVHNLHQIFETVMTSISQFIDVEIDPFYKKGVKKGEAIGIVKGEAIGRVEGEAIGRVEGEAIGRVEGKAEMVINLILETNLEDKTIASLAKIPVEIIAKFRLMIKEFPENYKEKIVFFLLNNAK
jgi:hypothetical protein